ncbi:MAG: Zn-ribbon containing protein [Nanoarchaeota archaeon]
MPHQCIRCSTLYDDGSAVILSGCTCGGKFFFYMKKKDIETVQQMTEKLTEDQKKQLEQDALDLVGEEKLEKPVILDLESIRMLKPGKFEIDLVDLFQGKPLVFKLEEGKYIIDLASTFDSMLNEK